MNWYHWLQIWCLIGLVVNTAMIGIFWDAHFKQGVRSAEKHGFSHDTFAHGLVAVLFVVLNAPIWPISTYREIRRNLSPERKEG